MIYREPDPYLVLGIGPDATGADIARAYRRLARAAHPDSRPGDPAAAGQFRALTDAYELLSDPARRAAWDHHNPPRAARHPDPPAPAWPAGPPLWPFPPAGQHWPSGRAALRAGPVIVQPPTPPVGGQHAPSEGSTALARSHWWLLAQARDWPW
jgi:DnaJ domain